jgi:hypothetical protein
MTSVSKTSNFHFKNSFWINIFLTQFKGRFLKPSVLLLAILRKFAWKINKFSENSTQKILTLQFTFYWLGREKVFLHIRNVKSQRQSQVFLKAYVKRH